MKTKALILAALLMGSSCSEKNKVNISEGMVVGSYGNAMQTYGMVVYTIDSCEYIGVLTGLNNDWVTHKGNCKYCKQRLK